MRGTLWGPGKDMPYAPAARAGLIDDAEHRAMGLLARTSDAPRARAYAATGLYPALGNMTRRVYLVRRFDKILEFVDEFTTRVWCIYTRDRYRVPETDHVVAMKNMIEGEEVMFRRVGIVGPAYNVKPCSLPVARQFLPDEVARDYASHLRSNDAIGDVEDALRQHEDALCAPLGRERRPLPEHIMRRWGCAGNQVQQMQFPVVGRGYEYRAGQPGEWYAEHAIAVDTRRVLEEIRAQLEGPVYALR